MLKPYIPVPPRLLLILNSAVSQGEIKIYHYQKKYT